MPRPASTAASQRQKYPGRKQKLHHITNEMQNLIEGELKSDAKVVVVEDLISTGGSSLKAVEALRKNGNEVIGMVASYTYGFPVAEKAFADAGVKLVTLTDYEHVVAEALETGYIAQEDVELLHDWRKDPANWKK